VLYAGFIITKDRGPYVLEYNCRFGDPEAQVLLPLLQSDLYRVMKSCADHRLKDEAVEWLADTSACAVVCASPGYPEAYKTGLKISGLESLISSTVSDVQVYHAGTIASDGDVLTSGGRVLAVTGVGSTLKSAVRNAYGGVQKISFDGMQYRTDIAKR
jgi:phosphoribosylamine-glycine ligase